MGMGKIDKTVVELFAGVGGFRLGLQQSGNWDIIWANQWEPKRISQYAFDCYCAHFKTGTHVNEDISKINATDIPNHTLLVGGFPCQDYSVAKTQAEGILGQKGVLWWEIKRILEAKQPSFVLLENVDRLLKSPSKQRGRDFGIMLGCLRDLGYSVEWRVINAAEYGYPQRRRRVFIFAFKNWTRYNHQLQNTSLADWILNKGFFQSMFPIEKIDSIFPKTNTLDLKENIIDISDNFSFDFQNTGIMTNGKILTINTVPQEEPETPLSSILENNVADFYYIKDDLEKWTYLKGAKREVRKSRYGYEYNYSEGAIAFPDHLNRPARTMLTSEGSINRSTHVILDPKTHKLRLLTPLECERLNGFEDNWTNTGMPHKFRYFCMGNALVVGLVRRMGKKLNDIIDLENNNLGIHLKNIVSI